MKILVACEESQAVTKELRRLGHEAYSCDIEPCSGGHPEWHLQVDALELLKMRWDMIIAHPPCTYLTVSGNAYFNEKKYGRKAMERKQKREQAADFFMKFVNADCPRIAVENPVGCMNTRYRKPDCIVQPYQFGHPYTKKTCFWLKGLEPLKPTKILKKPKCGWENQQMTQDGRYGGFGGKWGLRKDGKRLGYNDPEVKKERSKTFPGIARAMAEQWAGNGYGASDDLCEIE